MTPHEVRKVQLEVLAALDRHCREHGLTYYLGYGTLLVRSGTAASSPGTTTST